MNTEKFRKACYRALGNTPEMVLTWSPYGGVQPWYIRIPVHNGFMATYGETPDDAIDKLCVRLEGIYDERLKHAMNELEKVLNRGK